jgi:hypothetical protein
MSSMRFARPGPKRGELMRKGLHVKIVCQRVNLHHHPYSKIWILRFSVFTLKIVNGPIYS